MSMANEEVINAVSEITIIRKKTRRSNNNINDIGNVMDLIIEEDVEPMQRKK